MLYSVPEKETVEPPNCFIVTAPLIGHIVNPGATSVSVDYNVAAPSDVDSYVSTHDVRLSGGVETTCPCYNDVKDSEWCTACSGEWVKEVTTTAEGTHSTSGDAVLSVETADTKCCSGGHPTADEVYLPGAPGVMGCGSVEVAGAEDDADTTAGIPSKSSVLTGGPVAGLEVTEASCHGSCLHTPIVLFLLLRTVIACLLPRITVI